MSHKKLAKTLLLAGAVTLALAPDLAMARGGGARGGGGGGRGGGGRR